jgi:hypothetical protein
MTDTLLEKCTDISRHVSPCFATSCLLVFSRTLVDESGMIRNQMATHNGRSAWDALYDTTL